MNHLKKKICLLAYNHFAVHLPYTGSFFNIGGCIRLMLCKVIFKRCGSHVNIEKGARFGNGFELEIGDYSGIGINCTVPSNIIIGNYVMMGPNCFFLPVLTHVFNRKDIPMCKQGMKMIEDKTIIGNDVWIGRQCIVLYGKKINSGSIVGAGSVVSRDVPNYVIVAGNPIRVIRER